MHFSSEDILAVAGILKWGMFMFVESSNQANLKMLWAQTDNIIHGMKNSD